MVTILWMINIHEEYDTWGRPPTSRCHDCFSALNLMSDLDFFLWAIVLDIFHYFLTYHFAKYINEQEIISRIIENSLVVALLLCQTHGLGEICHKKYSQKI